MTVSLLFFCPDPDKHTENMCKCVDLTLQIWKNDLQKGNLHIFYVRFKEDLKRYVATQYFVRV